jgi:hypothetical protein
VKHETPQILQLAELGLSLVHFLERIKINIINSLLSLVLLSLSYRKESNVIFLSITISNYYK